MKKRITSFMLMATMLLLTFAPQTALANESIEKENLNITRVSGKDRYNTAIEASKSEFSNSDYVVIASGEGYADALTGGSLAVSVKAPILLTRKNSLPEEVIKEIERLNPKEVFLLGGEATVSKNVENKINNLGYKVERLAGQNRYETALQIAYKRFELTSDAPYMGDANVQFDGQNFAEALPAGPFVGKIDGLYLIPYKANGLGANMVIGGKNIIPKGFEDRRFEGNNVYATAVEVAKGYKEVLNQDIDTIILVDGTNYPDALASSTACTNRNAAVLLTTPKGLAKETREYIANNKNINNVIILGGEGSVSANVAKELQEIR